MEGRGAERIYWFFLPFMLSNVGTKLNVINFIDYVFDISLMGVVLV
jgi:hypothetical protein